MAECNLAMNLEAQNLGLLDRANRKRINLTSRFHQDSLTREYLLETLAEFAVDLNDAPSVGTKDIEFRNNVNLCKLISSVSNAPKATNKKRFKIPQGCIEAIIKGQQKEDCNPKVESSLAKSFEKAPKEENRNGDKDKDKGVEGFVSANTLQKPIANKLTASSGNAPISNGATNSLRKKFVPPFKKEEPLVEDHEEEKGSQADPRLKNLDPKLIQSIESEILEAGAATKWSDIAGLGFAKKTIHEMIVWPMLRPDIFVGLRAPPKGVLLFGPPGTGKTLIGKAIASESKSTFFNISASSLTSKWVGDGEKLVRTLFTVALVKQPSVIFIDEIDSLLCSRSEGQQESSRKIKTEFLVQLDGAKSNPNERILVIGATNRPSELDEAVRRRFVKRLYIPLPNREGREELFRRISHEVGFHLTEEDIVEAATLTKGYSGADLHNLCAEASMFPLRRVDISNINNREVPTTTISDLKEALAFVKSSVNGGELRNYEQWNQSFGSYQVSSSMDFDT